MIFDINKLEFDDENHKYYYNDRELISCTTLMQKHGLAPDFEGVSKEILEKAANKGSLVHKEIEDYLKQDIIGFTMELEKFREYFKNNPKVNVEKSEFKLFNDIVAGTADLLLKENNELIIADIKTTSQIHYDVVSWQLSIYSFLAKQCLGLEIKKGQCFHFDKNGYLTVVDIKLKPIVEIEKLMECERNGVIYAREIELLTKQEIANLEDIEQTIKYYENQKEIYEKKAKEMREALLKAMEKNAVKTFETEKLKISYVEKYTRESIDTTKLKEDLPEIANKYKKVSNVKATIKIKVKE